MNREDKRRQAREEARSERMQEKRVAERQELMTERKRTPPREYLREVRAELKRVAWPSRREVTSYTLVVLVTTAVLTTIIFGMDWLISKVVLQIFG